MREGARLELVNAVDELDDRKQGTAIPGRRENARPGGEVKVSVGKHATESSQPCRKGAIHGKIAALEAAYERYRLVQPMFPLQPCRPANS